MSLQGATPTDPYVKNSTHTVPRQTNARNSSSCSAKVERRLKKASAHNLCYPEALCTVPMTRLVVSEYLPSFPAQNGYARLRLPYSGSLGQHFPTLRNAVLRHSSVLYSAKTAKSPSRETSLRKAIVARYLACTQLFVSLPILLLPGPARCGAKVQRLYNARSLGKPVLLSFRLLCKETDGSPEFPGYPYVHMPRS